MSIAQALIDKWTGNAPDQTMRQEYKERLGEGVWVIEFIKVDGTLTRMEATLDPDIVPPLKEQKDIPGPNRPEQDHLISCYSPDRGGWRSFTVANVKSFIRKQ